MVGSPPASAGDTGSSPGPGRSHMPAMEQLGLSATTAELVLWSPQATTTEPTLRDC